MIQDEQEIRSLVSTWKEATRKGDIQTLLSLMTDNIVFLVSDDAQMAHRIPGKARVNACRSDVDTKLISDDSSETIKIQPLNKHVRMKTSLKVTITSSDNNSTVTHSNGCSLFVLKKLAGQWMIADGTNLSTSVQDNQR